MKVAEKRLRASGALGVLLAVALLFWVFRGVNVLRVQELVTAVPPTTLVVILLPQLMALAIESAAWRWAFLAIGVRLRWLSLLRIRIATEAVAISLPCGVVCAESLKPLLLGRLCDLPVSESISGMAARKYLLMASQSAYIGLFAILGWPALAGVSRSVAGVSGLPWFTLAAACLVGLLAFALGQLFRRSRLACALLGLLGRLPRLGPGLLRRAQSFTEVDDCVRRYFNSGARSATAPATLFFVAWCVESVETYLILRVLGVELDFVSVAAIEVTLSFLRNVVFVVPAGLGVQEAGYAAFLLALGVPHGLSVGAAMALLKRSKDLFWISSGWLLLAWELNGRKKALSPGRSRPVWLVT